MKQKNIEAHEMTFADHHYFSPHDILKIKKTATQLNTSVIITTEKDADW